jgi:hypothetical protein
VNEDKVRESASHTPEFASAADTAHQQATARGADTDGGDGFENRPSVPAFHATTMYGHAVIGHADAVAGHARTPRTKPAGVSLA